MVERRLVESRSGFQLEARVRSRGPNLGSKDNMSSRDEGVSQQWIGRLGKALEHLDDRSLLNANPLARLQYIERLAGEKYRGQILPRGLALRRVVLDCVDQVCIQLADESGLAKPCEYLRLRAAGHSCEDISARLQLSREHVSRAIRPKALHLLAQAFITLTRDERGSA